MGYGLLPKGLRGLVYKIHPKHKSKDLVIKTRDIVGMKEESGQFSIYMDVLVNKINDF